SKASDDTCGSPVRSGKEVSRELLQRRRTALEHSSIRLRQRLGNTPERTGFHRHCFGDHSRPAGYAAEVSQPNGPLKNSAILPLRPTMLQAHCQRFCACFALEPQQLRTPSWWRFKRETCAEA